MIDRAIRAFPLLGILFLFAACIPWYHDAESDLETAIELQPLGDGWIPDLAVLSRRPYRWRGRLIDVALVVEYPRREPSIRLEITNRSDQDVRVHATAEAFEPGAGRGRPPIERQWTLEPRRSAVLPVGDLDALARPSPGNVLESMVVASSPDGRDECHATFEIVSLRLGSWPP